MKPWCCNGNWPLGLGFLFLFSESVLGTTHPNLAAIDYWQYSNNPCPQACSAVGPNPSQWTYYHDINALRRCQNTYLFEMNLYNNLEPGSNVFYRACTSSLSTSKATPPNHRRQVLASSDNTPRELKTAIQLASWGTSTSSSSLAAVSSAVGQLSAYLENNSEHAPILFARSGNVVAGIYLGNEIQPSSATNIAQSFLSQVSSGITTRQAAQACHSSSPATSAQVFGLIVDTTGNLAAVQSALTSWNNGTCVSGSGGNKVLEGATIQLVSRNEVADGPSDDLLTASRRSELAERATCSYLTVKSGDTCYSLSQTCGITLSQFQSYNPNVNCNNIPVPSYVCCTAGTPPNFAPQPYANGTCYTYYVKSGDYCSAIATTYQMNVNVIMTSNNYTWGWLGCGTLFIGQAICLSSGNPPFPANVPNSVCGPQVNNTVFPTDYTKWAALNPCPLNACCDIYGQCGITSDFCTATTSSTGAPGTAAVGSNGCISNCGTQIITGSPPSSFARMGYFEAFNNQRPCMNMDPSQISSYYTHVNFAFANISSSYQVDVSGQQQFFNSFVKTTGFNKILSFGGWAFSTDPSTYPIFRQGVTAANRQTFANNVASFVQSNNLQGVDFDWEYPGPSIIPGIPNGSPADGANYLAFLQSLRSALPKQYTISITAPTSFYYLKNFPIYNMSQTVSYIIFMTYDLHGQWDYGNQYTDPGCPGGNCLRSHINMTEIQSAFSMITKAGVPANMIVMGQPLYGRSFQMTTAGCYTEMCTYTGPNSGALAGACTGTQGYISNVEINNIISGGALSGGVSQYYSSVAGDILVYASTQWVSWMKPSTYNYRSAWAQSLNLLGTADWAIDLNGTYAPVLTCRRKSDL